MNSTAEMITKALKSFDGGASCVKPDVYMSTLTSFRIGGLCSAAIFPRSPEELSAVCRAAAENGIPFCILGNGTNVLCSDKGFDGAAVMTTQMKEHSTLGNIITAGCGMSFTALAAEAARAGLSGLEFAYGIPGTVGGAVYMNAGAYSGETGAVCISSDYLDLTDYTVKTLSGAEQCFGYRKSAYQLNDKSRIILRARFELKPGSKPEIQSYMNELMRRRTEKQPLEYPSAGSVFRRCSTGYTGEMIEKCGLKGKKCGGAQISEKHAGFIINTGDATAADVLTLIALIKSSVFEKFGAELECEIRRIGDFA